MNIRAKAGLALLTSFCALVLLAAPLAPRPSGPYGSTAIGRFAHTATLLNNGQVLVTGGTSRNGVWLDSAEIAEIYDPGTGRFSRCRGTKKSFQGIAAQHRR